MESDQLHDQRDVWKKTRQAFDVVQVDLLVQSLRSGRNCGAIARFWELKTGLGPAK